MKNNLLAVLALSLLCAFNFQPATVFAQTSAFTYHGRLNDGTSPASGSYDLQFTIYDALSVGNVVGGPLTQAATAVSNGLFTVTLDFGGAVFTGADRWLEIAVRTNSSGTFSALAPRQRITSAPYAVRAAQASSFTGSIGLAQLPATVLTNNAHGVNISGTFSGSGAGVTNVSLTTLNTGGSFSWPGNFGLASSTDVGLGAVSVATADVNGDGKADFVTANYQDNTLSIATNNGSGVFVLASSPPVGAFPFSVAAGDVNGDGKVDLISANYGSNSVSILTNNGNGGFVLASSPGLGTGPVFVVAADINGDGKPDLITANYDANTLSILTNNGSGGFVLSASPGVGPTPISVAAADVNGDGKLDLISANSATNTLSILTNNGSGGFALASSPMVGPSPYSVTAADVNGDGRADLMSANFDNNTLSILINNGTGGFALASSPGVGDGPTSVAAADVNGDGKVDLITANNGGSSTTLSVLTNNGSGGFVLASSPIAGSLPRSVAVADVNGDGKPDLISANIVRVGVLLNVPGVLGGFTGSFAGNGSGLTGIQATNLSGTLDAAQIPDLNANQITSGVFSDARLSGNVARLNATQLFTGQNFFYNISNVFAGDGAGLVNINPFSIQSPFPDSRLSANVALRFANQTFSGVNAMTNVGNTFAGNGAGLSNLNAANIAGTLPDARLSANVALLNAPAQTFINSNTFSGVVVLNNPNNYLAGKAIGVTFLNADNISIGILPDARLSPNVALLNGNQVVRGVNLMTNAANSFTGNGAGLTTLNASQLLNGTVPDARLSSNVAFVNGANIFTSTNRFSGVAIITNANSQFSGGFSGAFSGNGGGLTNLNAANLTGSVPVASLTSVPAASLTGTIAEGQLSPNVALRNANQTFTGTNIFNSSLSLGSTNPLATLEIQAGADSSGTNDGKALALAWRNGGYRHFIRSRHDSAVGNGNAIEFFVNTSTAAAGSSAPGTSNVLVMTMGGTGNVGIGTNSPTEKLHVFGNIRATGTISGSSDRNVKQDFASINSREVLDKVAALPLSSWSYIADKNVRHLGPMAQDFHAAFGVGADERSISMVDADGVALAAIQGLNQKLEEQKGENAELKKRLSLLEAVLGKLAIKKD